MRTRTGAAVLAAALVFYLVAVGWRGLLLISAGGFGPVLLGLAVLLLPFIGGWALWREWVFGTATQRLGEELAARGELPVDDLPRRPSGRPETAAADARFAQARARLAEDPDSWERWFVLSVAYDWAGDRKRARSAMRTAIALHEGRVPRDRAIV